MPGGGAEFEYVAKFVPAGEDAVDVSLTILVTDESTGAPIEQANVQILDPAGGAVAALDGRRPGGEFTMPAPSGEWRLKVEAEGHEVHEAALELDPAQAEVEVAVRLRPR